jgi:hypothetical protein
VLLCEARELALEQPQIREAVPQLEHHPVRLGPRHVSHVRAPQSSRRSRRALAAAHLLEAGEQVADAQAFAAEVVEIRPIEHQQASPRLACHQCVTAAP